MFKAKKKEDYNKLVQTELIRFPKIKKQDHDVKKGRIEKNMTTCFNTLKEKGLFKDYKNYKHFLKMKNLC